MGVEIQLDGAVLGSVDASIDPPVPAPIANQGYQLVWRDEFETLDQDVWSAAPWRANQAPGVIENDTLRISIPAPNPFVGTFGNVLSTQGRRETTVPHYPDMRAWQYGYFESRFRFTDNQWAWPCFWLFSAAKSEAWPGENCALLTSEWDIMEAGLGNSTGTMTASRRFHATVHENTTDGTVDGYCGQPDRVDSKAYVAPAGTNLSDWHVWSGLWEPDRMRTYLDGNLVATITPFESTNQPMHLSFSIGYQGLCAGCSTPPPQMDMWVDYVRVWQK